MRPRALALVTVVTLSTLFLCGARQRTLRAPTPTFNREVVRIFQANCQSCHHTGDIAPFPLMTYRDAKPYAELIRIMTSAREMPPWTPVKGCRPLSESAGLTDQEIETIAKWVKNGAPEGDPRDLPAPRTFGSGWSGGTPDRIFRMPQPYLPPAGADTYRCFPIRSGLTSNVSISGFDTHPGDRTRVHHLAAYIDTTGSSEALDAKDPEPGYPCFGGPGFTNPRMLGAWGPGGRAVSLPPGVAIEIPAEARIVLQVHYHDSGVHDRSNAKPDQTEFGVYFSKDAAPKRLHFVTVTNNDFTIPANAANHEVSQLSAPTDVAGTIWLVAPHMHLLGRKVQLDALLPDGSSECLVRIDRWKFNWQRAYLLERALAIPAGTQLSVRAVYDNSADNPVNPNFPPKDVAWGEGTTDEMCVGVFGITWADGR